MTIRKKIASPTSDLTDDTDANLLPITAVTADQTHSAPASTAITAASTLSVVATGVNVSLDETAG
ncbi:hypothetical protein, partial [Pseudomonas putida]